MIRQSYHSGFSLVELSIVLVILGLLIGGILAGQNLIRAAELRSISTDVSRYITATMTFRDKYFAIPGDMRNATAFWDSAGCPDTAGTGTETCNGNGDGLLNPPVNPDEYGETFTFWQHLANAGLIEGTFDGIAGPDGRTDVAVGVNVPASRIGNNANYHTRYVGPITTSAFYFPGDYGNTLHFGRDSVTVNFDGDSPLITPEEAWNIDTKMDDGRPALGTVRVYLNSVRNNCADADTTSAVYQLDSDVVTCNLVFITGF